MKKSIILKPYVGILIAIKKLQMTKNRSDGEIVFSDGEPSKADPLGKKSFEERKASQKLR